VTHHPYSPWEVRSTVDAFKHWNEPRPSKEALEKVLCAAPNREIWLQAKRQYMEESDADLNT
jgi:hypothetical protein